MKLPPGEDARRAAAVAAAQAQGLSLAAAARALGIAPTTLRNWVHNQQGRGSLLPPPEKDAPAFNERALGSDAETARERRDAEFLRRRVAALTRELDEAVHLTEELAGIRAAVQPTPPDWHAAPGDGASRSVLILHTSDLHMGERVDAGEIAGLNGYDEEVARTRMHRLFSAACTVGPRWMEETSCDGVLLTMAGDLVSGDIHDELTRTNALVSNEQVRAVVEVYSAGIAMLLRTYPKVHVVAVPGNHGRQTAKPTAKLAARLSYDILAADMLRDRLREEARVSWSIATGFDVTVPLYGRNIMVTHGDRIGTGGGQGFAGPVLPIIRGGNKVRLQAHSAGLAVDLILMGHYHTSAAPPGILCNGSVVGLSEYGAGLRTAIESPRQWLARFSSNWGLCERLDVNLGERPSRMRVKAA
jgi:transposase-like protein